MVIAFDLTPVYEHLTGVERYNINISKEMILNHPENYYILIFKNEIHYEFKAIVSMENVEEVIIPECNKLLFIQYRLLKALNKIKADYYVFLSFTSPIFFTNERIINAIHDLTCWDCPDTIPFKMRLYYRYTYSVAAKHSWRLVTVSQFSQRRICEKYGLVKERVPVIYNGLTGIFKRECYDKTGVYETYSLPDRYILSLSTLEPRKNIGLLIKAYKELAEENVSLPDIILAGRQGWKLEGIKSSITEEISGRVHYIGFVADEDLPQLYRKAEVFIFPSKYEGFGLPVVEAMSQGTLVISSDAASLPEVIGKAGITFRSDDLNDLKRAIKYFYGLDEKEKEERRLLGISISNSFSWDKEAEKLYRIMAEN